MSETGLVDHGADTYPAVSGTCHWCGEWVTNGARQAGAAPGTVDWCADGDYGCDEHPTTTDNDGVGPHETADDVRAIVRSWHAHELRDVVPGADAVTAWAHQNGVRVALRAAHDSGVPVRIFAGGRERLVFVHRAGTIAGWVGPTADEADRSERVDYSHVGIL